MIAAVFLSSMFLLLFCLASTQDKVFATLSRHIHFHKKNYMTKAVLLLFPQDGR